MLGKKVFLGFLCILLCVQSLVPCVAFADEIVAIEGIESASEPAPAPKQAAPEPEPEPKPEPKPEPEPEPEPMPEPEPVMQSNEPDVEAIVDTVTNDITPVNGTQGKDASTFLVTFVDGLTNQQIATQDVPVGGTAAAPTPPDHTGYNFTGWDKAMTDIQSNTTITAQYAIISYVAKFLDIAGKTLLEYRVDYGQKAETLPTPPKVQNKRFTGWSPDPTTEKIVRDTDFQAQYEDATTHLATFMAVYGADSKLIDSQYVAEGEYANTPATPSIPGYKFSRWNMEPSTTPITQDTTFEAIYEVTDIEQVPLLTIEDKELTLNKTKTLSAYYSEIIASVISQLSDRVVTVAVVQAYLNDPSSVSDSDMDATTKTYVDGILKDLKSYVKALTLVCDKSVFQKNKNVAGKKNGQDQRFVFTTPKARKSTAGSDVVLVEMTISQDAYMHKWIRSDVETIDLLMPVTLVKAASGGGGGGGGGGGSTEKQIPQARLLIESVHTEPSNPSAGDTFDIVLNLRNTSSTLYLQNLQLSYSAEDDALLPVSGAGIEYIARIPADSAYTQRLRVKSKPDIEASRVKLDVSIDFEDKKFNALTATQTLNIDIKQVQRIELDEPELPTSDPTVGDSYDITMGVFNLGKTILYNVTARVIAKDENVTAGQSYYIGNMDGGTSKTVELNCVPMQAGEHAIDLQVTYETVDGYQTTSTKSVRFNTVAEETYDYSMDEYDYSETDPVETGVDAMSVMKSLPWWLYAAFAGLITIVFLSIGASVRRRRKRMFEDDEVE